jgi:transcriptional accessory protein Tex/SPT6
LEATISLPESKLGDLMKFFYETYMVDHHHLTSWNKMRIEVINILVNNILLKEIIKEVKEEIQIEAETFVINKCKRQYAELLMTGPFQTPKFDQQHNEQF